MFGLVKLIKSLLTFVAEVTAWVLLKFHLWVPAAFAVGFVMFCALGRRNPVDYSGVFFAGIGLSLVISILLLLATAMHKSRTTKKIEPPPKRYILEEHITLEKPAPQPVSAPPPHRPMNILNKYLDIPDEKPMLFASRKDPNLFICEYSSRIEVYQRRGDRVKLIEVIDKE